MLRPFPDQASHWQSSGAFRGDFALKFPHPAPFAVIESLDDDPIQIEEQGVCPDDIAVLHVRTMNLHDTPLIEIDRRGKTLPAWRGMGTTGNSHDHLRVAGQ